MRLGQLLGTWSYKELIYQRLFERDAARLGIDFPFYPVSSAASYCLLYLVLRLANELPINVVVEFGAGQSSILLDRINSSRPAPQPRMRVFTVEHDQYWATQIAGLVSHDVLVAPLTSKIVKEKSCEFYDLPDNSLPASFDLLLVDGPPGTRRRSRWGCLEYIEAHIGDNFIILFDDSSRRGEAETINRCRILLKGAGIDFGEARFRSNREQHLFCSRSFSAAVHF